MKDFLRKWGLISTPEPNKKVYVTTWSHHRLSDDDDEIDVVLPDDISYQQLSMLLGRRTKITVEILPW